MCLEGPNHPPIDYVVDDYQHGLIDRRQFLARATALLGLSAAAALLEACAPQPAPAPAAPPPAPTTAAKAAAPTTAPAAPTAAPTAAPAATTAPTAAPTAAPAATAAPKAAATAAPTAGAAAKAPAVPVYGTVAADASDLTAEEVTYDSSGIQMKGYMARPRTGGPFPAIILIHENRGLTPHERDVARRFARAGFVALAVDMLSRKGTTASIAGTPTGQGTPAAATAAINSLTEQEVLTDLNNTVKYLKAHDSVKGGKIGVVGWCWGGARSLLLAVKNPEIDAAITFYGSNPSDLNEIRNMRAAWLGLYGGTDQRINAGIPDLEAKLKEFNKTYEIKIYDGAGHAFHNDTGGNYKLDAAKDAWEKSVAWFNKYLRS